MKFSKPLLNISLGLLVLARELFSVCSAAVDSCGNQCDPGHFCKAYFGFCVECDKFCSDINDACQATCNKNKVPNLTTSNPTELPPILNVTRPNLLTILTSSVTSKTTTIYRLQYSSASPGGDGNHSILPNEGHGLFFGLFICMVIVTILAYNLVKYRRLLKMPNICCFTGVYRPSSDIEMAEINSSRPQDQMNITLNPMNNDTLVGYPTSSGPVHAVANDDDAAINQPGPSGLPPTPRPAVQPTSASRSTISHVDHPYQSATIRHAKHPRRVYENNRGAMPSDGQQPKQKTPDTHRKVADGTVRGHEIATGDRQLGELFLPGEMPWNRDSGHVD